MRYQYSSTANQSLSDGLFTDPSQLRVSRANLSDAGQYGYAGPTPSTAQNYGPGWNGDTWSNDYQFSDTPAQDSAQRAAMMGSQRGAGRPPALTDSSAENSILSGVPGATQLALAARRALSNQQFADEDERYGAFSKQPQFSQMLAPQTMALYEATYGHSPDEERKIRMAKMEAAIKAREFSQLPQKQAFDNHAAVAKELGFNPEVALSAYEALPPEERRKPMPTIHLPPHYSPNPMDPDKPIEVPGGPLTLSPRLLRILTGTRAHLEQYLPQGDLPATPEDPMIAQRQRWQELEAKAAAEAQSAQAASAAARNSETIFGFRRDAFR